MRSLIVTTLVLLSTAPALAHDTGEEHDHEFGPAKPKTPGAFVVTGAFGGLVGRSLGGDYEGCEGPNQCYDRKRPFSSYLEGRVGYQLPGSDLAFEVGLGYIAGLNATVARRTTLLGEQSVPVSVDIKDDVSASGIFAAVGVSYTFFRKPVVGALAVSVGNWWTEIETTRSGTAVTAAPPSPREMKPVSTATDANMLLVMPEARLAYPVLANLHVGLSLGGFFAFGEARPRIIQTPVVAPGDSQPSAPGTGVPPRPIGFVPQPNAEPESAIDGPIMFRSALFVSGLF